MAEYSFYRLREDNSIQPREDLPVPDDITAIVATEGMAHHRFVEIRHGVRKVARVAPDAARDPA